MLLLLLLELKCIPSRTYVNFCLLQSEKLCIASQREKQWNKLNDIICPTNAFDPEMELRIYARFTNFLSIAAF